MIINKGNYWHNTFYLTQGILMKASPINNSEISINKWAITKTTSFKIFDQIAPTYDLLNRLLSFGIDVWWRKMMMKHLPKAPLDRKLFALDLACGTADLSIELSKQKQVGKVIGMDLSQKMIDVGNKKIISKNLTAKLELHIGDACQIPSGDQNFDLVTISFGIRNFSDPLKSLKEIYRVLRPGGKLVIMEFSLPSNKFVKFVYLAYFRNILPFFGKIISKNQDAYKYLNKTVEEFPYGEDFLELINSSGFKESNQQTLTYGIASIYYATK